MKMNLKLNLGLGLYLNKKKKSRKGAALIIALVVTLVCGILITGIFGYVMQYGDFAQRERELYVDHTTLLSEMQIMKGIVIAANLADGATRHTPALVQKFTDPNGTPLTLADLRFGGDWNADKVVTSGLGPQRVEVEVYDMFYDLAWIDQAALREEGFPPHFRMGASANTGTGGVNDGGDGSGAIDDTTTSGSYGVGGITPESYGAYLVRGHLYDHDGNPVRTMEEAFVQILPDE